MKKGLIVICLTANFLFIHGAFQPVKSQPQGNIILTMPPILAAVNNSPSTCDATHLNLCATKTKCTNAGGYWYNNICNSSPQTSTTGCTGNEVTSATGRVWLDRNCGASQVAASSTDSAAYGDLYQWGRGADGHEKRTSGTTSTVSTGDVPGHGNFILSSSTYYYDWRTPQKDTLWQGVSGINNPCPSGFRLPTDAEWETERLSWSSNNSAGAFASPLKLVPAGGRYYSNGSLGFVGSNGSYWSSSVGGLDGRYLDFSSALANLYSVSRAYGFSVRCLKD